MNQGKLFDSLFWNSKPTTESSLPDPLGLDRLRDNLADILVPYLTGRSRYPEEVYWCLIILSWAQAPSYRERVSNFLKYEWKLKLVWARCRNNKSVASKLGCPPKFPGSDEATKKAEEYSDDDMPKTFTPLLANQRSQGMLGCYLKVLSKLDLVNKDLTLTSKGGKWCLGAGDCPSLQNRNWERWKSLLKKAYRGSSAFRKSLSLELRNNMPYLARGLASVHWCEKPPKWKEAADKMGEYENIAKFAEKYCNWADLLRGKFNILAEGKKVKLRINSISVPAKLFQQSADLKKAWHWVEKCGKDKKLALKGLAKRHEEVMKSRGYDPSDYWLIWDDENGKIITNPENVAQSVEYKGHDCRWASAINLMKEEKSH